MAKDPELAALERAFEAGNYRAVREGVLRVEKSDAPDDVKKAARSLRERTEPSRAQLVLLAIAAVFVVTLSVYEIVKHGRSAPPPAISPTTPRASVEHIR
jgi:hypothetical protein